MKKILEICSAIGLLTAMTMQIPAQEKSDETKKSDESNLVVAKTNVVKATVEEIDHAKREVTLKDAKGDEHKMKVSEEVKNLDQVKKGDQVAIGFYQSVGLSVHKPGEAPPPAQGQAVIVAEKGQKPGGLAVQTTQKTATVEDIDYSTREVTLKGSDGKTTKIKAGDKVKRLEDVKKGDRIVATYTEALAVSVAKPED
jgi:Cu/Ag efflux protein CusF